MIKQYLISTFICDRLVYFKLRPIMRNMRKLHLKKKIYMHCSSVKGQRSQSEGNHIEMHPVFGATFILGYLSLCKHHRL